MRLRDRVRRRRSSRPLLSVVVPVYQVEPYLAACLDSILDQPVRDLEVVVVDDGSTDGSAGILAAYAERDSRLVVHRQDNAGLGAARNAGVALATGTYLTFCDSDDLLPRNAYGPALRALAGTRSDFACGALARMEADRVWTSQRMAANHRARRLGATLDAMPEMLADVFAVNKVFRRDFWSSAELAFPVDVHYEDQPTLTRAFLRARQFDVLQDTVYEWRVRHDGSSITQRRHELADLRDRMLTKRWSTADVQQDASPHVQEVWFRTVLPIDMWEYFRAVPECDEEYWKLLVDSVREFWNERTVPFEKTALPLRQRLMGWLVAQDRRTDLELLLEFLDAHGGQIPRVDGQARHPLADDPDLPAALGFASTPGERHPGP